MHMEHYTIGAHYLFVLFVSEHQEWYCSEGIMRQHFAWGAGRGGGGVRALTVGDRTAVCPTQDSFGKFQVFRVGRVYNVYQSMAFCVVLQSRGRGGEGEGRERGSGLRGRASTSRG